VRSVVVPSFTVWVGWDVSGDSWWEIGEDWGGVERYKG